MPAALSCRYFDAGVCRSCALLDVPYSQQLTEKQLRARELIDPFGVAGGVRWLEPWANTPEGFRNRAKMVAGGRRGAPTLGILDADGKGVDLQECPLHEPVIVAALPKVAGFLAEAGIIPYGVPARQGELKHVLTTASPDGELMMRFVLRSTDQLRRLRRHLPQLLEALPNLRVVSVNILPEHKAVLEGEEEMLLAGEETLTMRVGGLNLHLRPQGFFQTCTAAAAAMYMQAARWAVASGADSDVRAEDGEVADSAAGGDGALDSGAGDGAGLRENKSAAWDLYCGVGGFALHLAQAAREARGTGASDAAQVTDKAARAAVDTDSGAPFAPFSHVIGVETSEDAVRAANTTAREAALDATFYAADATRWAREQFALIDAGHASAPALVVVNPPRRGIGAELAALLDGAGADGDARPGLRRVIYSSCNVESLAKDLARMPSWRVREARVVDMFPHTTHMEVMVDLVREP